VPSTGAAAPPLSVEKAKPKNAIAVLPSDSDGEEALTAEMENQDDLPGAAALKREEAEVEKLARELVEMEKADAGFQEGAHLLGLRSWPRQT
jgi:hypothetical protein